MSVPRWTPGPWRLVSENCILGSDDEPLAGVVLSPQRSKTENEANASLIAAAPTLYEALAVIVVADCALGKPLPRATLKRADAALAQARGEPAC